MTAEATWCQTQRAWQGAQIIFSVFTMPVFFFNRKDGWVG